MKRLLVFALCFVLLGCSALPEPKPSEEKQTEETPLTLKEVLEIFQPCIFKEDPTLFMGNYHQSVCRDI